MSNSSTVHFLISVCSLILSTTRIAHAQLAASPYFYENVRVLAIGVNDFQSPAINSLSQAEADAKEISELLADRFGFEADLLTGSNATKAALEQRLDEFQESASSDEALIVYFATHGHVIDYVAANETPPVRRRVGYLLLHDSDLDLTNPAAQTPEQWQQQAISMRWLVDRINRLPMQHVLLIADTCCSGFLTKRGGAASPELYNLLAGTSRTVLAATTQNEAATGGSFTPILRKQLMQCSRDAQILTVTDLFQALRPQVAQATQRRQTPQMSHVGDGDGEFLFFPLTLTDTEVQTVRTQVDRIKQATQQPATASHEVNVTLSRLGALRGVAQRVRQRADRTATLAEVVAATVTPAYWYGDRAAEETERWRELRDRYRVNAAWGDGLAMAALHVCAARGLGESRPEPDHDEAYRWAQSLLDVADAPGLGEWAAGRCYDYGWGVDANKQTALELYKTSHDEGFPLGTYAHAFHLMVDQPTRDSTLRARTMLQPLAEELPQAAAMLAQHFRGLIAPDLGFPTDFATAMHYDQLAYKGGEAFGGFMLYAAYAAGGRGLPPRDLKKAEAYLRETASLGFRDSQAALASELGHFTYYQSNYLNLPKDPQQSRRWLELAAEQGYPRACFALGRLLVEDSHQLGFRPDPTRARQNIDRAIEGGELPAIVTKSAWLYDGAGPYEKNHEQAFRLAKQAAERNDARGCALLGMYYEGGVTLNLTEIERQAGSYHRYSHHALHWYLRAMQAGGFEESENRLKKFRGHLNLERKGIPYGKASETGPTDVMAAWRAQFPDTARAFEQGDSSR